MIDIKNAKPPTVAALAATLLALKFRRNWLRWRTGTIWLVVVAILFLPLVLEAVGIEVNDFEIFKFRLAALMWFPVFVLSHWFAPDMGSDLIAELKPVTTGINSPLNKLLLQPEILQYVQAVAAQNRKLIWAEVVALQDWADDIQRKRVNSVESTPAELQLIRAVTA